MPENFFELQPTLFGHSIYLRPLQIEDAEHREMAVGFTFLSRLHWGGKVNAEMKDLMLAHAFKWAKRVWFHVGIDNIRSQKAMEKIGGKLSHTSPRTLNGCPVMHCYYFIDAD